MFSDLIVNPFRFNIYERYPTGPTPILFSISGNCAEAVDPMMPKITVEADLQELGLRRRRGGALRWVG